MATVIETVRNIFRIEELRQRIVFTALMLVVVRIGAHITIPGIDIEALKASTATSDPNNLFGLYDLFVGGAFHNAAIFAMGIMPYISASIILQLAGVFVPELMKLQREGEEGRRKINQWTRYLTGFRGRDASPWLEHQAHCNDGRDRRAVHRRRPGHTLYAHSGRGHDRGNDFPDVDR